MTEEELLQIKESIEKYLLANDYENAFLFIFDTYREIKFSR